MKKIIFLFIILILSACIPQVTVTSEVTVTLTPVPTETPIPTPTLHPQFIELQNLINDASDRFTLTPDGLIEEVTTNGGRQTVPNLHIDQNGIINIIFNNEHVVIEQSQITFDSENGVVIDGYTLDENDEWVEAMSEAEQQMYTNFEKYGQNLAQGVENGSYTVEIGEDDSVTVKDVAGKDVYRDGSFEPMFLGKLIVENGVCRQTEWTATQIGDPIKSADKVEFVDEYGQSLVNAKRIFVDSRLILNPGLKWRSYYMGEGCWAYINFSAEDQPDALMFWKNQNGKPLYQRVFLTPKE